SAVERSAPRDAATGDQRAARGTRVRGQLEMRSRVPLSGGHQLDAPAGAMTAASQPVAVPEAAMLNVRDSGTPPAAPGPAVGAAARGSNGGAVAGSHSASGAALVANDMHLGERVPPVWYHARLRISSREGVPELDLNGVTLPGEPLLVAGSNGHIAWGFTNSYGNWFDVEPAPCTTRQGGAPFTVAHEEIRVRGAA